MPQLLSDVGKGRVIEFGPESPNRNPDLAARILMVTSRWGKLDALIGEIFAKFLGTNADIGAAVYSRLISSNTQEAAMQEAAKLSLDKEQFDFYTAIQKISKRPRNERNKIAHGIWGWSEDLPDALLLQTPKDAIKSKAAGAAVEADFQQFMRHGTPVDEDRARHLALNAFNSHRDSIWVYRRADTDTILDQIQVAYDLWWNFRNFVFYRHHIPPLPAELFDSLRRQLLANNDVLQSVNRDRSERGEDPLVPL